jgi:hypothetical protein
MSDKSVILLSVVVRIVGGAVFLEKCLGHLIPQSRNRQIEIIVPYDATVGSMSRLRTRFPEIVFIDMGFVKTDAPSGTHAAAHELYDRRTAAGLNLARGKILALLEDYGVPEPDWCEQILEAHKLPYGVIGGSVAHRGTGVLNWAVYFIDFGRYQPPLPEGPASYLTDVNVSYKRSSLESVKAVWAKQYNEVVVHWALAKQSAVLWLRPQITVCEDRGVLNLNDLVRERFAWGRLFGSTRSKQMTGAQRFLYVVFSPFIPIVLIARMTKKIARNRRMWGWFLKTLPFTVALSVVWSLGELIGYVTGQASSGPVEPAPSSAVSHANRG